MKFKHLALPILMAAGALGFAVDRANTETIQQPNGDEVVVDHVLRTVTVRPISHRCQDAMFLSEDHGTLTAYVPCPSHRFGGAWKTAVPVELANVWREHLN